MMTDAQVMRLRWKLSALVEVSRMKLWLIVLCRRRHASREDSRETLVSRKF